MAHLHQSGIKYPHILDQTRGVSVDYFFSSLYQDSDKRQTVHIKK